jgi:hypothetical protein
VGWGVGKGETHFFLVYSEWDFPNIRLYLPIIFIRVYSECL